MSETPSSGTSPKTEKGENKSGDTGIDKSIILNGHFRGIRDDIRRINLIQGNGKWRALVNG
jgi:hypothetical protein